VIDFTATFEGVKPMTGKLKMGDCGVAELKHYLETGARNLIDVREYPEYAGGRIKGARHIPLGDIDTRHSEIDRDETAYLICRSGKRASEAQKKLVSLGFADVRNVQGGFEAWKAAGFDIEKDAKPVWSLERQVRFAAGSLVVLGVSMSWMIHSYFIALSAFVGAGLIFAAVTDTCTMAMILAKMPWNKNRDAVCETATREA
jgi:rhodanese-related sulfurtransferase